MNIEQRMAAQSPAVDTQAEIGARLERLPVTREVFWARNIVGAATFFDGYTVIAIAYAMPVLVREWGLTPGQTGMILSMGYLGQLIGAICFGWLAERIGRLKVLLFTILLFVSMDVACLFCGRGRHDDGIPFHPRHRNRRRSSGRECIYQRVDQLEGAGPLLPAV